MKKHLIFRLPVLMLALLMGLSFALTSCSDDDDDPEVVSADKTALLQLISDLEAVANAATTTDYPAEAIATFKSTLSTVKTAAAATLTQAQVNSLTTQLNEAKKLFDSKAYGFIDESLYLVAGWHFDEGSGTTATAYGTIKHVATFNKGSEKIFGADAGSPSWTDGLIGKAINFEKGSYLETPWNTVFLPADLSISVWIKPSELYENNYIVSQNYWNGYKLQTQGGGKPFFTYKKSDGGIIDADNETDQSIKAGQWNHIVVTLDGTANELKFYVGGVLTKTWNAENKGIGPLTRSLEKELPFIIGAVATNAEAETFDWGVTPENHGYFKGVIDELKVYSTPLTAGQVTKLYNDEKPAK